MNRGGNITTYKYDKEGNLEYQTDENGIIEDVSIPQQDFLKKNKQMLAASCHCPMHQIAFPSQPHL
jgi:YD repeat-containing protein